MLNTAFHKDASCRRQRGGGALGAYTRFIRFPCLINKEHEEAGRRGLMMKLVTVTDYFLFHLNDLKQGGGT